MWTIRKLVIGHTLTVWLATRGRRSPISRSPNSQDQDLPSAIPVQALDGAVVLTEGVGPRPWCVGLAHARVQTPRSKA